MTEIQIGANQNLEIPIEIEVNLDLANMYNVGIVAKLGPLNAPKINDLYMTKSQD